MKIRILTAYSKTASQGQEKISYEHINNRYNICNLSFQQLGAER